MNRKGMPAVNGLGDAKRPRRQTYAKEVKLAVAAELFAICTATLSDHGLTRTEISRLRNNRFKKNAELPATTKLLNDISDMGKLVNEWAESPSYIDPTGRPKILAMHGPAPSFSHLARKHFGRRSLKDVLEIGTATQVLELVGTDKVAHLGACVLLTGNPILLLAHAVRSIRWFLATADHNSWKGGHNKATWPERQAYAELSEAEFQEFLKFAREPIINFSEMCNRWLMTRPPSRGGTRKIYMGAQAYVFRDP